jgi:putative selenium metabolism hydrolase
MGAIDQYLEVLEDNTPRMIEFLREIVRTPSLSGEERAVAELVAEEARGLGYEVDLDRMGNVVARRGAGDGRTILFDGHLDHIQPGDPENWSHEPYAAEVVDGMMYGRATVDMKGALASMIYGCAAPEVRGEIILSCVVHEETNEGAATRNVIKEGRLKLAACVLGEPTDLLLSLGQRGRCVLRVVTKGATSHASMPELGRNALYEMVPVIERIQEANEHLPRHPFLGSGTMAVTSITCRPGAGPIVPDYCEIQVDRRLVPQETLDGVLAEMRALAPGAEVELLEDEFVCYTGYKEKAKQYFQGWITDRDHWAVRESLKALEDGMGRRPGVTGWRFSTDGVATAGELSIPTVGFGPGDPSLAHQPDEHVALSDVVAAARGYCALAYRLAA